MKQTYTIEVEQLRLELDRHQGVHVSSLRVRAGEILALLGPNGAGKSTLLELLALLQRPTSGSIMLKGQRVDHLRGRSLLNARRHIACVFQQPLLLDRSVRFNVELGLAIRRVPLKKRRTLAQDAMGRLGIEHLAERRATQISGGEAQRTSIARALALDPQVLLLDEPFSGLDDLAGRQLIADMGELVQKTNVAAVLVTHDQTEAQVLAHRVAVMFAGRVVQVGDTAQVLASPIAPEVAGFLGFQNQFQANFIDHSRLGDVVNTSGELRLCLAGTAPAKSMIIGFRPEDIRMSPAQPQVSPQSTKARPNVIPARVTRMLSVGFSTQLELEAGEKLHALFTTREVIDSDLQVGSSITLEIPPEKIRSWPIKQVPMTRA